jgi:hypothetical protein
MPDPETHPQQTLVIRSARPTDQAAMRRLAQLDGRRDFDADRILVAEVDGVPRAALAFNGGEAIADPFHPSASLLELLRVRAAQLRGEAPARPRRGLRSRLAGLRRASGQRPAIAPATPDNAALLISRTPR